MDLSRTRELFERQGPFATVYLEATNPGENAAKQTELRWRGLSKSLSEQGADDKTIAALDELFADTAGGELDAYGRVIVASADRAATLAQPPVHVRGWAQTHPGYLPERGSQWGLTSGAAISGPAAGGRPGGGAG